MKDSSTCLMFGSAAPPSTSSHLVVWDDKRCTCSGPRSLRRQGLTPVRLPGLCAWSRRARTGRGVVASAPRAQWRAVCSMAGRVIAQPPCTGTLSDVCTHDVCAARIRSFRARCPARKTEPVRPGVTVDPVTERNRRTGKRQPEGVGLSAFFHGPPFWWRHCSYIHPGSPLCCGGTRSGEMRRDARSGAGVRPRPCDHGHGSACSVWGSPRSRRALNVTGCRVPRAQWRVTPLTPCECHTSTRRSASGPTGRVVQSSRARARWRPGAPPTDS